MGANNKWKRGPRLAAVPPSWIRTIETAIIVRGMSKVASEIGVPAARIAIILERSTCSEATMKLISAWIWSFGTTLHQENDWTVEQKANLIAMSCECDGGNKVDALRAAITSVGMIVTDESALRSVLQMLTESATGVVRSRRRAGATPHKVGVAPGSRVSDGGVVEEITFGGDFDKVIGDESELADLMDEEVEDDGNG